MLKIFKVIFFGRNAHLLGCVSEQVKLSALEKIKMKSSKAMLVTWTFHLPLKRQLSSLLNCFFRFLDARYFFPSLRLQHCRTIVQYSTMVTRFLAKRNAGYTKAPRNFRQARMAFSSPCQATPLESRHLSPRGSFVWTLRVVYFPLKHSYLYT